MGELVAVLDADVLVPILSCDLLLSAFDHDLYVPAVTPRILEEVERTLLTDFARLDPVPLRGRAGHVRTALSFHTHPDSELSDGIARVNPKDRHVAALARAVGADVVVSNDRRLRRQLQGLDPPVTALTADDLALRLLDQDPQAMTGVLDAMVAKCRRRPVTRDDLVAQLASAFPGFASELGQLPAAGD